ncbi:MAG: hypothetical protein MJ124_00155 [Lachnospiraceae bacterium]|nr:hypothetical protein [Lachnospiraceae bacterium]
MNQNGISLKAYRIFDLFILTLLACAVELINIIVLKKLFPAELFSLSLVIPLSLIAMQRWGLRAWMIPAAGGLAYCVANSGSFGSYVVYIVGNCFVLLNALWCRNEGKKRIEESTGMKIAFTATGFLVVEIGRTLLALIFEVGEQGFVPALTNSFRGFIVSDALNIVIGIIVVLIAGRQPGLFMDQLEYLKALQAEREKNKQISSGGYDEEGQDDEFDS